MSTPDEDRELELALALSMQQSPTRKAMPSECGQEVVDLTSDTEDEDEDLKKAIALSLMDSEAVQWPTEAGTDAADVRQVPPHSILKVAPSSPPTANTPIVPAHPATGILGLDRKAMEQERLARLGKRKRESSPARPSKQRSRTPNDWADQSKESTSSSTDSKLQYPRGTIKRTYATKFPRTNDITIDEVLEADTVNIAVISSFMWDSDWLNQKLNPLRTKQIWIMNAKGVDVQRRWRHEMEECGIPNLKLHFPPMHGMINCMHSKFMLLFGKEKLRIVVTSANMTPIDWGEVKNDWQPGVMENSVFLIDLPRRPDALPVDRESLTAFAKELLHFLDAQGIDQKVVDGVLKFDFSQASHLAFVHSIGGSHSEEVQHPTGFPGLSEAICNLRLDNVTHLELDYAASSLGAINETLLQRLYLAACGLPYKTTSAAEGVRDRIRIYFPTETTVKKSIGGPDCGGVLTLSAHHFNASTFPRGCLKNYDSTRHGVLSHNKLLFARGRQKNGQGFAWVYVGSANLSESAWGSQKVLKSGQMGTLNIRNWEAGVVVSVPDDKLANLKLARDEVPPMSVFQDTIEIPFVFPGQAYGSEMPWIFK